MVGEGWREGGYGGNCEVPPKKLRVKKDISRMTLKINEMDDLVSNLLWDISKGLSVNPVTFELCWQKDPFDIDSFAIAKDRLEHEIDPVIRDQLEKEGWDWISFPNLIEVHGINQAGGNEDVRGGGCNSSQGKIIIIP